MRVLFVSFFYPPFNSIGGLRVSKMSRYVADHGWDVRVLTTDRDDLTDDLRVEIPEEHIIRVRQFDVNALPKMVLGRERIRARGYDVAGRRSALRWLGLAYREVTNFPDGQIGWYLPAVRRGTDLLESWRPDVIVSSALPGTAHLVAHALARRSAVPWIAEYRDPWTDACGYHRPWPLSRIEKRLEHRVVRRAASIVTVSDAWAAQFRARYPDTRVHVVPNGFDPADYPDLAPRRSVPLELLYSGRLYGRQTVRPLLDALRWTVAAGSLKAGGIRLRFLGRYLAEARAAIAADPALRQIVEIGGVVSHREALAAQKAAHVLVLVLGGDEDIGWRPAKLYEYLGAQRPILLIGGSPAHEARRIMLQCRAGVFAEDAERVSTLLLAWHAELRKTGEVAYRGDHAEIERYERAALAARFSAILGEVTPPARAAGRRDGLPGPAPGRA